ncbi:unnamed protein product, partial [Onchocerca ochengi]|uniref:Uncharacterized protein n=1 Tax=Onchocerca ochengi TaxID=42157 RepID=A0A182EUD6_ONCOC
MFSSALRLKRSAEDGSKLATTQMWMVNGQHIHFTVANMQQIAPNPPAFFTSRQINVFAKLVSYYIRIIHGRRIESYLNDSNLCLRIANKVLNQLGMPSPNRSAAASFDVELHREQNYDTLDLFSD